MDFVTRQFIVLAKKLRKELRKDLSSLGVHIKNAIESVYKRTEFQRNEKPSSQEVVAILHETEATEKERKRHNKSTQRRDRIRLLIEVLTLAAVVFYGYMAVRPWREMIAVRHQAEGAITAATRSADAVEKANLLVQRAFIFPKPESLKATPGTCSSKMLASIDWENSGTTPPKELQLRVNYYTKLPQDHCDWGKPTTSPIAPKGAAPFYSDHIPRSVLNGKLYIYGWASYYDLFQDTNKTARHTTRSPHNPE